MNLLCLAPDIQEEIFFQPPVTEGQPAVTERDLREVLKTVVWSEQRERWMAFTADALAGIILFGRFLQCDLAGRPLFNAS